MKILLKGFFRILSGLATKVARPLRLFTCLFLLFTSLASKAQNNINIVPMPAEIKLGKGNFTINRNTQIILEGGGLEKIAKLLNDHLKNTVGFSLPITKTGNSNNKIVLNYERMDFKFPGAYTMDINDKEIYIAGDNEAGIFYGIQTLIQLLSVTNHYPLSIPQLSIADHPRFQYRGMHLDVGRHFFSVEQVKKYIDHLAEYKFNTLHWHLTEDQGWRIEIKKYPKLTSVGAYRNGTIIGSYPGTGNDSIYYGGFYTQQQIKEIVQYAADRYIDIIPEIEMPGHSSAAIAAYPQLSCFPDESSAIPSNTAWAGSRKGKQVQQSWGVFEDVLCPSEYTFKFLEDVLDEVMQLFPSRYIHIGGDESPKESWKRSAFCQQLIKEKKLKDEHGLQSYFIQRVEKYINSKGKKIIGWDEILEGGLAPNATVMSWRGETGGIAAAKQDHDVIMTPENPLYLNHAQSKNEDSVTQGGYNPLENVYNYEPVPTELNEAQSKHILGAQGNMWSEHLKNEKKLEYMLFPRLAALSEVLWSPKEKRNFNDFEKRLPGIFKRLDNRGINYSNAYYYLKDSLFANDGKIGWILKTNAAYKIKAGMDFDIERTSSYHNDTIIPDYTGPIEFYNNNLAVAILYDSINKKILSKIEREFHFNKATAKKITLVNKPSVNYPGNGPFTLVDGIHNNKGMMRSSEFVGFSGTDLDATIDLGAETNISTIILHVFDQPGSWIYLPRLLEITYSPDEKMTDPLKIVRKAIDPVKEMGARTIRIDSNQQCRYLRVVAKNIGVIPDGNPGSGNPGWLFVDEIEVR